MPESETTQKEDDAMKERIDSLETVVRTLATQQIERDKTMERIMVTVEAHIAEESKDEARYDQTMRNLNDTLKQIQLELAGQPSVRSREIRDETERLWSSMRNQQEKFIEHKDHCAVVHSSLDRNVKDDLRKEAGRHFKGIYVAGGVLVLLVSALYFDMKTDIKTNATHAVTPHADRQGK